MSRKGKIPFGKVPHWNKDAPHVKRGMRARTEKAELIPFPKLDIFEASIVSVPANADAVLAAAGIGQKVKNPIPALVTADTIGDATGFADGRRVYALGYTGAWNRDEFPKPWEAFEMPDAVMTRRAPDMLGSPTYVIEPVFHPLGVTYLLDFGGRGVNPWRMQFSGPRDGRHRARVAWAGGGDYCLADDCEGYDLVCAHAGTDEHMITVGKWRGSRRVWVGFDFAGLAGFEGELCAMGADVVAGETPARGFAEYLCERYRLPNPLVAAAERCGFYPEKN